MILHGVVSLSGLKLSRISPPSKVSPSSISVNSTVDSGSGCTSFHFFSDSSIINGTISSLGAKHPLLQQLLCHQECSRFLQQELPVVL